VGPRAGLDRQKISSPPGFDSGPSSPYSVSIPTELPDPSSGSTTLYIQQLVYVMQFMLTGC